MIEIKPMDEEFLLPDCLHEGPIDAAAFEPDAETDSSARVLSQPGGLASKRYSGGMTTKYLRLVVSVALACAGMAPMADAAEVIIQPERRAAEVSPLLFGTQFEFHGRFLSDNC